VSANAYADAAAKTYLYAAPAAHATTQITDALPAGRRAQMIRTEHGWAHWPETRFTAAREAIGWWVRRRAVAQRARHAVDTGRIGPTWDSRTAQRWDAVWEQTGARTARVEDVADTPDSNDATLEDAAM
jgi:hypothetical protein